MSTYTNQTIPIYQDAGAGSAQAAPVDSPAEAAAQAAAQADAAAAANEQAQAAANNAAAQVADDAAAQLEAENAANAANQRAAADAAAAEAVAAAGMRNMEEDQRAAELAAANEAAAIAEANANAYANAPIFANATTPIFLNGTGTMTMGTAVPTISGFPVPINSTNSTGTVPCPPQYNAETIVRRGPVPRAKAEYAADMPPAEESWNPLGSSGGSVPDLTSQIGIFLTAVAGLCLAVLTMYWVHVKVKRRRNVDALPTAAGGRGGFLGVFRKKTGLQTAQENAEEGSFSEKEKAAAFAHLSPSNSARTAGESYRDQVADRR